MRQTAYPSSLVLAGTIVFLLAGCNTESVTDPAIVEPLFQEIFSYDEHFNVQGTWTGFGIVADSGSIKFVDSAASVPFYSLLQTHAVTSPRAITVRHGTQGSIMTVAQVFVTAPYDDYSQPYQGDFQGSWEILTSTGRYANLTGGGTWRATFVETYGFPVVVETKFFGEDLHFK